MVSCSTHSLTIFSFLESSTIYSKHIEEVLFNIYRYQRYLTFVKIFFIIIG